MKHIALGLDFDGCLLSQQYIFPFTPEKVGDIKTNTSIIDINSDLWTFIIELCTKNPDLEKLTLIHFSARQDPLTDATNSADNQTESFFLAMTKIETHVANLLIAHAPHAKVELDQLLMPDIYNCREIGDTRREALENIDYTLTGRGMITSNQDQYDYYHLPDTSKVTFAHVHAINADAFYYLDDLEKIHQSIQLFYNNKIGSDFIPKDVKVISYIYYEGKLTTEPRCTIIGTGHRCSQYGDILRTLQSESHSSPIFDVRIKSTYSLIEKFHRIRQIYQDPLSGAQHTPQQTTLIHSILFPPTWALHTDSFKMKKLTPLQEKLAESYLKNFETSDTVSCQK